jgi:DnaA family protein
MSDQARGAQLALDFRWNNAADLETFVATGNEQAVAAIEGLTGWFAQSLYLTGPPGSGRSHLLQAACGRMSAAGGAAVYLPLGRYVDGPPTPLDGLEALSLVAVDDLERLAGRGDWQEAFFHLFNRLRDAGGLLVVAAAGAPAGLGIALPDLVSRLESILRLRLTPPDDDRRRELLSAALARRGLSIPAAGIEYLLRHQARDPAHLLAVVERLDGASLRAGRRLTVPFIKAVLGDQPAD